MFRKSILKTTKNICSRGSLSVRTNCSMANFKESLDLVNPQATQTMRWNIDTDASEGNYLVDSEGRKILDAFMQISSIPLGYNNQELMHEISQDSVLKMIVSRSSVGMFPPAKLPELLELPLSIKPQGMHHIQTLMCGACTVENAFKCAFGYAADKSRNGGRPTEIELKSCMDGILPGSTNRVILGFRGSFHGRTFGSLSVTNSKAGIKVDFPAFDWPHAPFPELKYPLDDPANIRENQAEENRCLEEIEEIFHSYNNVKKRPVAALIIEPIQGEGGDRIASDQFYRNLKKICEKYDSVFIVDEVQTGFGATGKWWASDFWGIESDILCYAKKAQACGFYYNKKFADNPDTRIFNTWMGEPLKMVMMSKCIEIINRDNLLKNAENVGNMLHNGLLDLEKESFGQASQVRGRGLFQAFDMDSTDNQGRFVKKAFENGLMIGPCGPKGIRFRPSLNFSEEECSKTLDILRKTIKQI